MAYVFNNLDQAMAQQPQSQTNIFQQPQASQTEDGNAENPTREGDSGSAVGAQSSGSAAPQTGGAKPGQGGQDLAGILSKNKAEAPSFVGNLASKQSNASKQLSNESSAYLNGPKSQNYGLDNSIIDKGAAGGDADAYNQVATRLNQTAAKAVDPFKESEALQRSFTEMQPEITALKGDQQLGGYLKSKGGSQYNQGQARLDQLLISQNPEYQKQRAAVTAQQQQLQSKRDQEAALQEQAQAAAQQQYDQSTKAIRDHLAQLQSGYAAEMEQRAQAENQARAALNGRGFDDFAGSQAQQVQAQFIAEHPELAQYVNQAGLSPNAYGHVNGTVNSAQMVNADDAARFSRLSQLLGSGPVYSGAGDGGGDRQTFNASKYQEDLLSRAAAEKQRSEAAARSEALRQLAERNAAEEAAQQVARNAAMQPPTFNPNQDTLGARGQSTPIIGSPQNTLDKVMKPVNAIRKRF